MGLFNFSKKKKSTPIKDMIWMSQSAKQNGCLKFIKEQPDVVVAVWFNETEEVFNQFLNQQNGFRVEIQHAKSMHSSQVSEKNLVFLEHYPLREKEEEVIANLNPKQVYVFSSLDEPLFNQFGGGKIVDLMKNLGMKEDEMIEHPMISKSIESAQHKLAQKVTIENSANSAKEWFIRNLGEDIK